MINSKIEVYCTFCNSIENALWLSDRAGQGFEMNRKTVLVSINTGIGFSGMNKMKRRVQPTIIEQNVGSFIRICK